MRTVEKGQKSLPQEMPLTLKEFREEVVVVMPDEISEIQSPEEEDKEDRKKSKKRQMASIHAFAE